MTPWENPEVDFADNQAMCSSECGKASGSQVLQPTCEEPVSAGRAWMFWLQAPHHPSHFLTRTSWRVDCSIAADPHSSSKRCSWTIAVDSERIIYGKGWKAEKGTWIHTAHPSLTPPLDEDLEWSPQQWKLQLCSICSPHRHWNTIFRCKSISIEEVVFVLIVHYSYSWVQHL